MKAQELYEIVGDRSLLEVVDQIADIVEVELDQPNVYHKVTFKSDGDFWLYLDEIAFYCPEDWDDFVAQIDDQVDDQEIIIAAVIAA